MIQGEGHLIGRPTLFVRTGGCDYRCRWCDTMYAVDPINRATWHRMAEVDVLQRLKALANPPMLVTISGGNPALHDLRGLLTALEFSGYEVAMETQGSIVREWFSQLHHLVISPKPPSARTHDVSMATLAACIDAAESYRNGVVVFKVVVFNERDYEYAVHIHQTFPRVPCYVSVGTDAREPVHVEWTGLGPRQSILMRLPWLMERVAGDKRMHDVRVLPQLHVLAYGGQRGR